MSVFEKFKDELTCSICKELLKQPKTLPCLHSFCHDCLADYVKKRPVGEDESDSKVPCPNCRCTVTLTRQNGVAAIGTNHCLQNLVEHLRLEQQMRGTAERDGVGDLVCDSCEDPDNRAVAVCRDCSEFLCQACMDAHRRMKKTKQHRLADLAEMRSCSPSESAKSVWVSRKTWKCSTHFREGVDHHEDKLSDMIMYCIDCREVICIKCSLVAPHSKHNKGFTRDIIRCEEHQAMIEREIVEMKRTRGNVDESFARLIQLECDMEANKERKQGEIDAQYEHVKKKVENQKKSVLQQINQIYQKHRMDILEQKKEVEDQVQVLRCTLKFVECRTTLGSPEDIICFKEYMCTRLDRLHNELAIPLLRKGTISFVKGNRDLTGVMGSVSAEPCIDNDLDKVPFVVNTKIDFFIKLCDAVDNPLHPPENELLIEIYPVGEPHREERIKAELLRVKNRKFKVTLTPRKSGTHYISMKVLKNKFFEPVKGSPHKVEVLPHPRHWLWEVVA